MESRGVNLRLILKKNTPNGTPSPAPDCHLYAGNCHSRAFRTYDYPSGAGPMLKDQRVSTFLPLAVAPTITVTWRA